MKKLIYILVALFATITATSCLYGVGSDEGIDIEDNSGFKVEVSASVISANGMDSAVFRALYNGQSVTEGITIYDAESNEVIELSDMSFTTYVPGVYTFYVVYNNGTQEYRSEVISVTAVNDLDLSDIEEEGLSLTLSSNLVQVDNGYVTFVIRYNGSVLTPEEAVKVKIYDAETDQQVELQYAEFEGEGGKKFSLPTYTATEAGAKSFWISYKIYNTIKSPVTITAVSANIPPRPVDLQPANTNFVRRVLFTQLTGTWCGNCPYLISAFHDLSALDQYKDKYVHTAVHNKDGLECKVGQFDLSDMTNYTGNYPFVLYNLSEAMPTHNREYNLARMCGIIDVESKRPALVSIAARTEMKDGQLLVRASVKANKSAEYSIGCWLLESKLVRPQSNSTGIKEDYLDIHENVVRIADSVKPGTTRNLQGYDIGMINAGDRSDYLFVLELDPSWVVENCHLVLFVFSDNAMANVVQTKSLTSGVEFEYSTNK